MRILPYKKQRPKFFISAFIHAPNLSKESNLCLNKVDILYVAIGHVCNPYDHNFASHSSPMYTMLRHCWTPSKSGHARPLSVMIYTTNHRPDRMDWLRVGLTYHTIPAYLRNRTKISRKTVRRFTLMSHFQPRHQLRCRCHRIVFVVS